MFARKLIRRLRTPESTISECIAIDKLREKTNEHLVCIFRLGALRNSPYVFFDMELCDFNLSDFISAPERHKFRLSTIYRNEEYQFQVWDIVTQITRALHFLHTNLAMHVNLKPQNGIQS